MRARHPAPEPCSTLLLGPLESCLATPTSRLHSFLASSIRSTSDKSDRLHTSYLLATPAFPSNPSKQLSVPFPGDTSHSTPCTCSGIKYFGQICVSSPSFHLMPPLGASSLCRVALSRFRPLRLGTGFDHQSHRLQMCHEG